MKWQIAEEYIEEYVAKVHRTMSPRGKTQKFISHIPSTTTTTPDQQSPLRSRYPPTTTTTSSTTEGTPIRPLQISPHQPDYLMSSPSHPNSIHQQHTTPERQTPHRQFMPMSSPAPFYRYSSITTPGSALERSSPPSSGAIDLAETLVEFSSPVKLREPFTTRRISTPSEHDDSPSRRPQQNGIKSSLGDLQGVDLLRWFEKISSWREGSSPVKGDGRSVTPGREEGGGGG